MQAVFRHAFLGNLGKFGEVALLRINELCKTIQNFGEWVVFLLKHTCEKQTSRYSSLNCSYMKTHEEKSCHVPLIKLHFQ